MVSIDYFNVGTAVNLTVNHNRTLSEVWWSKPLMADSQEIHLCGLRIRAFPEYCCGGGGYYGSPAFLQKITSML
jgi:hypothetical protein